MKKNDKNSAYIYFREAEETVIRTDETQKKAISKKFKQRRIKKQFWNVISFILVIAIVVSGAFLGKRGIEKFLVLRQEQELHDASTLSEEDKKELAGMTEEEQWAYLYEKYPELINVKFPSGILCEYALYYAKNPQTVGYIKIDGTKVDMPVAQAENNKYYLNHDFYGKATSYGAVFASYKNNFKPFDRNTLLYGHNMNDGSRFASLLNYRSMSYFKEHPVIQYDSIYEKHLWKVYAVVITNGSAKSDNGYFFDFTFNQCSDACFEEYIGEIDKRKIYETGVDLLPTDTILTLCTCTYEYPDARLIVIARMVRDGEDPSVDTSLAKIKNSPVKLPDSYYEDEKDNPYAKDKKFYLY